MSAFSWQPTTSAVPSSSSPSSMLAKVEKRKGDMIPCFSISDRASFSPGCLWRGIPRVRRTLRREGVRGSPWHGRKEKKVNNNRNRAKWGGWMKEEKFGHFGVERHEWWWYCCTQVHTSRVEWKMKEEKDVNRATLKITYLLYQHQEHSYCKQVCCKINT